MIRVDAVWLATAPLDMRAGPDTALARVVSVFGAARPLAVDGLLQAQAAADTRYFQAMTGGRHDAGRIGDCVLKAYRWQYIVSGVMEPRFRNVLFALLDGPQQARIEAALAPLAYAVPAQEEPLPLAA